MLSWLLLLLLVCMIAGCWFQVVHAVRGTVHRIPFGTWPRQTMSSADEEGTLVALRHALTEAAAYDNETTEDLIYTDEDGDDIVITTASALCAALSACVDARAQDGGVKRATLRIRVEPRAQPTAAAGAPTLMDTEAPVLGNTALLTDSTQVQAQSHPTQPVPRSDSTMWLVGMGAAAAFVGAAVMLRSRR